jgi:predicted glycoside hydrolase/deacetylase ChbG (UPF0249 family)
MPVATRQLVVNADDFGLAPGVNRGILEAHSAGSLTSTSALVTGQAFVEAAALARERAPTLGIGLHLDLVAGRPLTHAPSLTDARTGHFHSLGALARRALVGGVRAAEVRRECDAQLAALMQAGIRPTHLDSHRHAHALPGVLPAVLASARAAGIRIVRRPLDRIALRHPIASTKIAMLHAAWRRAISGVAREDHQLIERAPRFRGITLQGASDVRARLLDFLDRLEPGTTELMLHPGYDDTELAALDPYRAPRERELAALTSPEWRERLAANEIRLVSFAEL